MEDPLQNLEEHVGALHATWAGALPPFGLIPGRAGAVMKQMSNSGLVAVTDALAQMRRDTEALLTCAAAEVSQRSGAEFGVDGLAKACGFHNPARLIAASTGTSVTEASRLIRVGVATASRETFSGSLPPAHPHVADALSSGTIGVDAADLITAMLDRVANRADPALAVEVEGILVDHAVNLPLDLLARAVKEAEAGLDQDGLEPADELRWQSRSLTFREHRDGMIHLNARLDPLTAAGIKTAIDALVTAALRQQRGVGSTGRSTSDQAAWDSIDGACVVSGGDAHDGRSAIDDTRTISQMQADALADLVTHNLGCSSADTALATTTTVVRMDVEGLIDGLGRATIDGIDQPISAASARLLATDGEFLPLVLGEASVPLDMGRRARLFSKEQRLALGERDGGCASCGQNIRYAHAHHIRWWERDGGPTDLDNGVMLCSFCHHMIHRDGWGIAIRAGTVWFTPPPHIDPLQKPRIGGRERFRVKVPALV